MDFMKLHTKFYVVKFCDRYKKLCEAGCGWAKSCEYCEAIRNVYFAEEKSRDEFVLKVSGGFHD